MVAILCVENTLDPDRGCSQGSKFILTSAVKEGTSEYLINSPEFLRGPQNTVFTVLEMMYMVD